MSKRPLEVNRKKIWGMFAAGFLWGTAFTFIIGTLLIRHSLIKTYVSKYNFKDTVATLTARAKSMKGWKVSFGACAAPRLRDGSKIKVLKLCHAKYGAELINDPASRKTAAIIPCSMAIYETPGGPVFVSRLNTSLVGIILGGRAGEIFTTQVAPEQETMMEAVIDK